MDFLTEFNPDKKYVFDKDIYMEYMMHLNFYTDEKELEQLWISMCNNKQVEIKSELFGIIKIRDTEYEISPSWCREVPSIRLLTENDL